MPRDSEPRTSDDDATNKLNLGPGALSGNLEENVLTGLVWHDELAPLLASRLETSIFSSKVYRDIAKAAIDYLSKYKRPAKAHLPDLMENETSKGAGGRNLLAILERMQKIAPDLDAEFIADQVDGFVEWRLMGMAIEEAAGLWHRGDLEGARGRLFAGARASLPSAEVYNPWGEPVAPEFPIEALPKKLAVIVSAGTEAMGCDPGGLAWTMLSAGSAAIDGSIRLRMRHDNSFNVPPGINVLLCGVSALAMKTPIMRIAWNPLEQLQVARFREYERKLARWKGDKDTEEPRMEQLVTQNATPEALQEILAGQDRGIALHQDEFAELIGSVDKYNASKAAGFADRAFYLLSNEGRPYTANRVGKKRPVNNLHIVICGGVQPDRLRELGNLTSDGLLQRFAVILLSPARRGDTSKTLGGHLVDYENLIEELTRIPGGKVFKLTDMAHEIRERVEEYLDGWTQNDTLGGGFQQFCGKLKGLWGRLALVLGLIENPNAEKIDEKAAEAAACLIENLIKHAARFYTWLGGSGRMDDTRQVAGYLLAHPKSRILLSELSRDSTVCKGRSHEDILKTLSPLITGGWLSPETDHPRPRAFSINQAIYTQFAARAVQETERRLQVWNAIQEEAATRRNSGGQGNRDKRDSARGSEFANSSSSHIYSYSNADSSKPNFLRRAHKQDHLDSQDSPGSAKADVDSPRNPEGSVDSPREPETEGARHELNGRPFRYRRRSRAQWDRRLDGNA